MSFVASARMRRVESENSMPCLNVRLPLVLTPTAVSYTHLDVYKRQVGDMHCPMHAGRLSDIGGNLRPVLMFGKKTNLHSAWDTAIPEAAHNFIIF